LLSASLPPCRRYHPVEVECRYLPACDPRCCLHPGAKDSTFEISTFRGYPCVRLRCGPVTRSRPSDRLSRWASGHWFPSSLPSKLQGCWPFALTGLSPAERASLRWTHRPQRVLAAHSPDQRSNVGVYSWAASHLAGFPVPVGGETASVPTDHGLRLGDDVRVQERRVQFDKAISTGADRCPQPRAL
jgi:hypothetical protein